MEKILKWKMSFNLATTQKYTRTKNYDKALKTYMSLLKIKSPNVEGAILAFEILKPKATI